MKRLYFLFSLFWLIAGTVPAQRIVSLGNQVTDASQLNTSDHYVIKLVSYYSGSTKTDVTDDKYFYTTGARMIAGTLDMSNTTVNNTTNNYLINLRANSSNTSGVWAVGMGSYYVSSFITGSGGFNTSGTKENYGYQFISTGEDGCFKMRGYRDGTAGLYINYNNTSSQTEVTSSEATAMLVKIYKANTNVEEGKFYNLTMRGTSTSNNVVFDNGLYTKTNSTKSTGTDGVWFFKKDLTSLCRWYMYNAEVGDEYGLTATTDNNSRAAFTTSPTSLKVITGNGNRVAAGGFALNVSGNASLNDVSGAIGVWNAEVSLTDDGSTFVPTAISDAAYALCNFTFTDQTHNITVVRHTYQKVGEAPSIPTLGYFTATTTLSGAVSATEANNYTVEGTFNYPFTISTTDNPTWYSMRARLTETGRDIVVNGSSVDSRVTFSNVATTYARFNDGLFSFIQSGKGENFKIKSRSGKYLKLVATTNSDKYYDSRNLITTTTESDASDFKIQKSTYSGAADADFLILPVFSHSTSTYVIGDHNAGKLTVWSGNSNTNGAYGDDGSRFAIKDVNASADILAIGATAQANTLAAAAPSTYLGGLTATAINNFKAATYSSLSDIEAKALTCQTTEENLQKPQTNKFYTLRFTRYGDSSPVYASFKNAVADANGTVNAGSGNTPTERLLGFSTTVSAPNIVRFVQSGDNFFIQDVNTKYYYGSYGDNTNVYAVANSDYAGAYTVENSIDGTLTTVGLKNTKQTDITKQYFFCCGDNATEASNGGERDCLQFHSPYPDNATTGDKTTIEPGVKMQIQEISTYPITISEAGYASLCLPFSVTLPTGVTANKVSAVTSENNELTLESVGSTLAANEAVILQGTAGTYNLTINTDEGTKASGNILTGATVKRTGITDTYYALGYKALDADSETKTAGLYKVSTQTMPANKAYLLKNSIPAESQNAMMFSFNFGESTGIHKVVADNADSDIYYDLNGHRVLYPAHGIYVKGNGKKVFIK